MTSADWQQVEQILDEAFELDPADRAAFLDVACAGNAALRRDVETLLAAEAEAPAFLEDDAAAFAGPAFQGDGSFGAEGIVQGERVGSYRLVREVGRGGMGIVYLAEQDDVDRQVALKLVRGGLADPTATQRFLFERRVLARLEHPHIARLYEAGVADDGTPYFAMEYVEGQPLDAYCDAQRLSLEERLHLFETVGHAVQHAHQNFVVHRDLKPSNILVTEEDGRAQVKLLDFGIAKVLAEAEEAQTETLTRTGRHMLTPAYAAPEQLRGETVTAATDVYSLGVVLYELLTGRRPYEVTGSDLQAAQAVLTQDPKKPSTAVTEQAGHGDTAETAQARATTADRLSRRLRGDLDVICLKALAKEPERRYASAEAFVEDVRRHLAGLPVTARPDTAGYRLKKFVRRHRQGVLASVAVVALLVLVSGFYTVQLRQERDQAQREAERANQVTQFLINVFEEADPENARGDTLNAYQILERGVARLETEMAGQPAQQAAIQDAIGHVYRHLGDYAHAQALTTTALTTRERLYGHAHPDVAASLASLGLVYQRTGAYARADSAYQEALAIIQDTYGTGHPRWVEYLNHRGQVLIDQGEYETAEVLLRDALDTGLKNLGQLHPEVAFSYDYLARALKEQGNYEAALPLTQEALSIARALYGDEHPHVASYLSSLGSIYFNMGDDEQSERYNRETLSTYRRLYGDAHPDVASAYANLASSLRNQGQAEEAIGLYQKALAIMRRTYGDTHPSIASVLYNLGNALRDVGRLDEAEVVLREMLTIDELALGATHPLVGTDKHMLAVLLRDIGRYEEALRLNVEAVTLLREKLPSDHRYLGHALAGYGITLLMLGDPAAAEPELRDGIDVLGRAYTDGHWSVGDAKAWLGACLSQQGRYEEAEPLLVEGHTQLLEARGAEDRYTRQAAQHLAELYEAWGKPDQAAPYRALLDEHT